MPTAYCPDAPEITCGAEVSDRIEFNVAAPSSFDDGNPEHNIVAVHCVLYSGTAAPTASPTLSPTHGPTASPSHSPTRAPSAHPTEGATAIPTQSPTFAPSASQTGSPSLRPSVVPTGSPTAAPSSRPTTAPSGRPTASTLSPTAFPTVPLSGPPNVVHDYDFEQAGVSVTASWRVPGSATEITKFQIRLFDDATEQILNNWKIGPADDLLVYSEGGAVVSITFDVGASQQAYRFATRTQNGDGWSPYGGESFLSLDVAGRRLGLGLGTQDARRQARARLTAGVRARRLAFREGTEVEIPFSALPHTEAVDTSESDSSECYTAVCHAEANGCTSEDSDEVECCSIDTTPSPTFATTAFPTTLSTHEPTAFPTALPTERPTESPTHRPTVSPTTYCPDAPEITCGAEVSDRIEFNVAAPSSFDDGNPEHNIVAVHCVLYSGTAAPTASPTLSPTHGPTASPSHSPTRAPSAHPTEGATAIPTQSPTFAPSASQTGSPSLRPSVVPTGSPTAAPSSRPTTAPSGRPTASTLSPTAFPTVPLSGPPNVVHDYDFEQAGVSVTASWRVPGSATEITKFQIRLFDDATEQILNNWKIGPADDLLVYSEGGAVVSITFDVGASQQAYRFATRTQNGDGWSPYGGESFLSLDVAGRRLGLGLGTQDARRQARARLILCR